MQTPPEPKAKVFRNGRSQAVRLPAAFRMQADEVFVRRNETTGDVVLSERPTAPDWKTLLANLHSTPGAEEFEEIIRHRERSLPVERNWPWDDKLG